jgi:hypothetical protein
MAAWGVLTALDDGYGERCAMWASANKLYCASLLWELHPPTADGRTS